MELNDTINLIMFLSVCVCLMMGFPVAFTLAGVALIFGSLGAVLGVFDLSFISAMPNRIFGNAMTNEILLAVPLFVFMGVMLERSKVAEQLLETMGQLFGDLRGGLGISVSIVGALLAASTGIVGATVVTMGLLSLPTMLKQGYDRGLACGSICAAGTLGQLIPPSIVLIILGDQISNAYVDAQRELGNWSPEPVSVGDLFAGALLPGLMLVGLYILYQVGMAIFKPESSPPIHFEGSRRDLYKQALSALFPPIILIISVLGSILAGIATPTEAASVGAIGATLLAGYRVHILGISQNRLDKGMVDKMRGVSKTLCAIMGRLDAGKHWPIISAFIALSILVVLTFSMDLRIQRDHIPLYDMIGTGVAILCILIASYGILVAVWRLWATSIMRAVMQKTIETTSMVFVILIGAAMFSLVFRGYGGDEAVKEILEQIPGGKFGAIFAVMALMFILGFFLDFIEITFVVVPIVAPVLLQMDISPVWLGVMMAMNLQTSFLTPPFGFALFYLRGVAPNSVKTMDIYWGVAPFVIIQLIGLGILATFPELANWLPRVIFDTDFS